jgi:hypothetical protein
MHPQINRSRARRQHARTATYRRRALAVRSAPARPQTISDQDDALACPRCGDSYLHHERITVYQREHGKEDARHLIKTTVGDGVSIETVRAEGSRCPSARRDGLLISFWCEGCNARPELTIEQHSGQTFFRWRI